MLSSFYPVVPGRSSDALKRNRTLYQLQVDQIGLEAIQRQVSSGLRFTNPSEDPSAAIRVIGLQSAQEFKAQSLQNLKSSQTFLNVTETALSQSQDLVNEARGTAIAAADSTLSDAERDAMLAQIDGLLTRLVALGNTRHQNRFLLGGGLVTREPIQLDSDGIRFLGNDLSLLSVADENDYIAHNVTAQRALGVISEGVTSTVDLNPGVLATTRLNDLNSGQGVAPGAFQLSDGSEQVIVDIIGSETLQDVIDRISNVTLSGRTVTATLSSAGIEIDYTDAAGGVLRVTDLGAGRSAADLGIASASPAPSLPIVGNDLDPILRLSTLVSQFNGGAGFDLQGGILIQQGGEEYQVDLANANTVEDILNAITGSGASVTADLTPDGQSIRVRSIKSGVSFSIGEDSGDLASRMGLRTFHAGTRLEELNYGAGIQYVTGPELTIGRIDGTDLNVELEGAITIQDVLDRINLHVDNLNPSNRVNASINATGNGISLSSITAGATSPLSIRAAGGSEVAQVLGLIPIGQSQVTATVNGTQYEIVGSDPNPQEIKGIYNSLIRLRNAVRDSNFAEISRVENLIRQDSDRLSLSRGEVGVRQQRVDSLIAFAEETEIELKSQESDAIDADLAAVIAELTAKQTSLQASLTLLGQTARLSLFDFL